MEDLPDTQTPHEVLTPICKKEIKNPWGRFLSCLSELKDIDLVNPTLRLGRANNCDIIIRAPEFPSNQIGSISKEHFSVTREPGCPVYIKDLSKNGTFLNGIKIGKNNTYILQNNDVISLGIQTLKVFIFKSMETDNETYLPLPLRSKYEVGKVLGRGAVGEVRLVYEKTTCEMYAVKKIVKGKVSSSNWHQLNHPKKIQTEINIMKSLCHPCVIALKEIVETEDEVFIILEYMEGGELTSRILSIEPLEETNVKFLFYQIVLAVQYLHMKGITHRDIKPENILLASSDAETLIKISDFGLSKIMDTESLMQTICGTPNYVAPEVLDGKCTNYDEKVDVWSLGVLLYYMLSQKLPFISNNKTTTFKMILSGKYNMEGSNWKGISVLAKDLVRRMLTVKPSARLSVGQILKHSWIAKDVSMQYRVSQLMKLGNTFTDSFSDCEPPTKKFRLG